MVQPQEQQPDRQHPRENFEELSSREGVSLADARLAKEHLKELLAQEGITVSLGITPLGQDQYGIAVRVLPAHSLSETQLLRVAEMRNFEGVPVDFRQADYNPRAQEQDG